MTEQEVKHLVKQCGWSYLPRMRKGHWYAYVARKQAGKREEVYIGPVARFARLTADHLKQKLSCVTL